MKVKDFIKYLQTEDQEANVELTKLIAVTRPKDASGNVDAYEMRLDFPIIGMASKGDDLLLLIEALPEMIAFGKDIKRVDGKSLTEGDLKNIGVKKE